MDDEEKFVRNGEPTEAAIRVLVEKLGCPDEALNKRCLQKEKRSKDDAMAFSNHWMKGRTTNSMFFFGAAVLYCLSLLLHYQVQCQISCCLSCFRHGEESCAGVQQRPQVDECFVA